MFRGSGFFPLLEVAEFAGVVEFAKAASVTGELGVGRGRVCTNLGMIMLINKMKIFVRVVWQFLLVGTICSQ